MTLVSGVERLVDCIVSFRFISFRFVSFSFISLRLGLGWLGWIVNLGDVFAFTAGKASGMTIP